MKYRHSFRAICLLASVLVPAALFVGGCGGAGDGSRPADLKVNEPRIAGQFNFSGLTPGALVDATPLLAISSIAPANLVNTRTPNGNSQRLSLNVATENAVVTSLALSLGSSVNGAAPTPFRGGQRLEFPRVGSSVELTQTTGIGEVRRFRAVGGAVVVRGLSETSAELAFDNLRFEPAEANSAQGSFTLNGALRASALTVRG